MKKLFDLNSIFSLCFIGFFLTSFIQFLAYLLGYNSPSNLLISSINSYQIYLPQTIETVIFFKAVILQFLQYFIIYLALRYFIKHKIEFYIKSVKRFITPIFLKKLYFLTLLFSFLVFVNIFLKTNYLSYYLIVLIKFLFIMYFFLLFNKYKFKKIYILIIITIFFYLQFNQFEANFGRGSLLSLLFSIFFIYIYSDSKKSVFKSFTFISLTILVAVFLTSIKFSFENNIFYFAIDQIFSRLNLAQSNYWVLESPRLFVNYDDSLNRLTNFIIPFFDFVNYNNSYNLNQYAFQLAYGGDLVEELGVYGGYAFTPIAESLINFKSLPASLLFIFVYYFFLAFIIRSLLKLNPLLIFSLINFFVVGVLFPENLTYITQIIMRDSFLILIFCFWLIRK